MDLLVRAVVAAVVAVTSSGVLQPDAGNGVSEIHATEHPIGVSVKGVEAFRGTPRPDATAVQVVCLAACAKAYARARLSAAQFHCLDLLWTRESHWNHLLLYRPTGAYGIPQAVPGRKMATAGADWRTNPITQVRWGLGYIRARYGTPCRAWAQSERTGWY